MKTVTVPVIKSDEDLHAALERMRLLLGNADEESEDEIGVLALVIEDYETNTFPLGIPTLLR
jgi:antitoxin component HigA of HigAB toxin-antitoxin module